MPPTRYQNKEVIYILNSNMMKILIKSNEVLLLGATGLVLENKMLSERTD